MIKGTELKVVATVYDDKKQEFTYIRLNNDKCYFNGTGDIEALEQLQKETKEQLNLYFLGHK